MSQSSDRTGILVDVHGSPGSDAALRWGAQEAAMPHAPLAPIHVATPVVASWPLGPMHGTISEWWQINADDVLEQARKTVEACAAASELTTRAPRCCGSALYRRCRVTGF